jgi:hypothetical protein
MVRLVVLGLVCSGIAAATAWAVVERDRVTISATRLIAEDGRPVILSGRISSRRSGEVVILEQDDCGPIPWHRLLQVFSGSEGGWRSNGGADVTARFRVRWRKVVSRAITIKARPYVTLEALSVGFRVKVAALHFFRDRVAELQRFGANGKWTTIARTRLERTNSAANGVSEGVFRTKVRKGATVRAMISDRQARPCYTAGFSEPQRAP